MFRYVTANEPELKVKVGTTEVVVSEHAFCESKQSSAAAYNNNQAGYQNQGQSYQGQSYQNPTPNNQSNNYSQNYAAAGGGQNTTNAAPFVNIIQ